MSWSLADTRQSIPDRLRNQARLHPLRRAVTGTGWEPTLAELAGAADRIALDLLDRDPEPAARVPVLMGHDAPLVAAVLGVLAAGKVAVPLSPADGPARLAAIVADVGARTVLTDPAHRALAAQAAGGAEVVTVPSRPDVSGGPSPGVAVAPDAPALVIFTSGSIGRPRGVLQTHATVLHNVLRHTTGLGIRDDDRIVLLGALSGGQGIGTTWTALLNGATLCPFAVAERGLTGLPAWLAAHEATVLPLSASLFRALARTLDGERLDTLRLVRLASEPAFRTDLELFRRHFPPSCVLVNTYSTSETGTIARHVVGPAAQEPGPRLPVGVPAEGVEVLLLDEGGAEAAPGETGQIVVRSGHLSPGYWNDAASTEQRFGEDAAGRWFRTGDLGRRDEAGVLTHLGRVDHQVKVNGNRVELLEVELALAGVPGVAAAAVSASEPPVRLTGFVAPGGGAVDTGALRERLRDVLPSHAVPSRFVVLDALPVQASGKVDRRRLEELATADEAGAASGDGDEHDWLAMIWAQALGREGVPRDAGFLDLGGDSLSAAVVAAQVHARTGVDLDLRAFAENATVVALAERVASATATPDEVPLRRRPPGEAAPTSFAQERVWHSAGTPEGRLGHTMAVPVRLRGPLDVARLRDCLDRIAARHEILRTTFAERDGRPVQLVHPPRPLPLAAHDLRSATDPAADARAILAADAAAPFDLERGPLMRLRLVRVADDEHWLLRVNHHIISDGWSWKILFDELRTLYEGGEPRPLGVQYGDFAAWQRATVARDRERSAWWLRRLAAPHDPLPLPFARTVPPATPPAPGVLWWGLPADVAARADVLGRQRGATFLMVRLAAFAAVLAIDTGRDDLVVGMYVSNRGRPELQTLFGDFTNLVVLRLRFTRGASFRHWLAEVRDAVVETSAHGDLPYALLDRDLRDAGVAPPEIRAVFGRAHQVPPMRIGALDVEPLAAPLQRAPTGFTFLVDQAYERDRCTTYFDSSSLDPAGVQAFVDRYRRLLADVSVRPDRAMG